MHALLPALLPHPGAAPMLLAAQLTHLAPVDYAILGLYFAMVIFIGFYVKGSTNTSEEFFLAGREMSAWIAGLSFVSANLGSLELMGWAGAAYQYGILATHWYWIGAIPAMLFLGIVMMPFYYISKTHSVPGYLQLRFGEGARGLSAICFAFMTVLMSGVNMYSMALVMKVVLGWDINFSVWVGAITVAVYVMLGGLRSAIINEVLQFVLIWAGAALIPILGLIEAGGWTSLKSQIITRMGDPAYMHLWSTIGSFDTNPMGVHWTGIVFGLGFVISFGYWTTDFLVVQRVLSANNLRAARLAPIIGSAFKMFVPFFVILPGLLALVLLKDSAGHLIQLYPDGSDMVVHHGAHSFNEVLPLMMVRYLGPGLLGLGITALVAGFMSGMAGNVSAFSPLWTLPLLHRVDLRHLRRLLQQEGLRLTLRLHGPLVHRRWHGCVRRHCVPCESRRQHHGLRAGAVQLLHRAALRHRHPWHVVEARHQGRRLLGTLRRHRRLHRYVGRGRARPRQHPLHDPEAPRLRRHHRPRAGHGRQPLPRALGLVRLRARHHRRQLHDQTHARVVPHRPRLRQHHHPR
jgi:SSS family transporter